VHEINVAQAQKQHTQNLEGHIKQRYHVPIHVSVTCPIQHTTS